MPIFFIMTIIFCLLLSLKLSSATKHQNKISKKIFELEKKSFSTKSKDISSLPYISLQEILPINMSKDPYLNELQNKLLQLSEKKILNLTGYTNTELRYMYGAKNLTSLTEYDTNFYHLSVLIHKIGERLYELGNIAEVKRLYEFAVNIQVDISDIYLTLSKIYLLDGTTNKISYLLESASKLNSLSSQNVIENIAPLTEKIGQ